PSAGLLPRNDVDGDGQRALGCRLLPVSSRFYPGCFYIHDLAFIGGALFANSVGQNAIVRADQGAAGRPVWWPRCIEQSGIPIFGQNHIQLNSIAAGDTLETSYFSASSATVETLRPGDPRYLVDRRGVIYSGRTREPVIVGLTRPHSARLSVRSLWVAN